MRSLRTPLTRAFAVLGAAVTLAGLTPTGAAASTTVDAQVTADQAALARAQSDLDAIQARVEHSQALLDAADRQLDADAARESTIRTQLAQIARYEYAQPSLALRVFGAGSLTQALAQVREEQIVGEHRGSLLDEQQVITRRDAATRLAQAEELKAIEADRARADAIVQSAQAALAQARAEQSRQLAAQLAMRARAVTASGNMGTATGNHFAFGYCTWYVANRRPIPWFGNAIEWWPNAASYGYAEGQSPQVGAVMVTMESSVGHVAYVESVNGDGSWTVSEMNYAGWDVVTSRTLRPGQAPVVGFIYGKA